jgi:hypothetical protein
MTLGLLRFLCFIFGNFLLFPRYLFVHKTLSKEARCLDPLKKKHGTTLT